MHILQLDDIVEIMNILNKNHVYYTKLASHPIADLFKRNDDLHQGRTRRWSDQRVELFTTSIASWEKLRLYGNITLVQNTSRLL